MAAAPPSTQPGGVDAAVVRRAPFAGTPIGARGQRTQQRIVDAALRVFVEVGYHGASVDRIAQLGGCSRVAFYQYFSGKDDVFRHLAGLVARQLVASTEAIEPVTADRDGWLAIRAWISRYAEIYARYQPVFNAYQVAVDANAHADEQNVTRIHARVAGSTLVPSQLDSVISILLECLSHSLDVAGVLRSVSPEAYPTDRVEDSLADVWHRALFGVQVDVNTRARADRAPPALALPPLSGEIDPPNRTTWEHATSALAALVERGRDVFIERGYDNTRIEDLIAAAGVSRGAFYRYFRHKRDLARVITARGTQEIGVTLADIPDVAALDTALARRALRRWLRRYSEVHLNEAAMLRVWVEGALQDPALTAESAAPLDWGRRRLAAYLQPRGFADVDMDAVVMVALLGVFGARTRSSVELDATEHVIQQGLLGRGPTDGSNGEPSRV